MDIKNVIHSNCQNHDLRPTLKNANKEFKQTTVITVN